MSCSGHIFRSVTFYCLRLIVGILAAGVCPAVTADPACRSGEYDDRIGVQHVIDGDTIVMDDGRKLRLIGIDTPELGRDDRPAQPFAVEAKAFLVSLLQAHPGGLHVIYGRERQDNYQRRLGHLFLEDGENIQALILAAGLATPLTIPPNLRFLECYRSSTKKAAGSRSGIWSLKQFQPLRVQDLTGSERGYRVVTGTVSRIGDSSSSVWVNMGGSFALRILKSDLKYFTDLDIHKLKGNTVEARGMVYRRNNQLRIRIRHPVEIRLSGVQHGTRPD